MGMFWKVMRWGSVPQSALVLQETRGTWSRWWPVLWRIGQYRYLLQVVGRTSQYQGYYVYFYLETQKKIVRYHQLIHTPYVSVRVGPEKIYYWAETRTHEPLNLTYTGNKKAGPLVLRRRNENKLTSRLSLTYI
jgi:hypothetical protein